MRDSFVARISVTGQCNLRCAHCDGPPSIHKDISYENMCAILEAIYEAGIRVLHWTGGEPTLRKDIVSLISRAHSLGFQYQKLTTNGLQLKELSADLNRNGLNRVNISVPSVTREGYQSATGRDALPLILEGIRRAATLFDMVKMNVCLNRNNTDSVFDYLHLARQLGNRVVVKFIELVPCGNQFENREDLFDSAFYSIGDALAAISAVYKVDPISLGHYSRLKCKYYRIHDLDIVFGLNPNRSIGYACQRTACRDLRFSPTGMVSDCSVNLVHLYNLLELSANEKREAIRRLIELKINRSSAEWASYSHTQKYYGFWRFGCYTNYTDQYIKAREEI